MIGLDKVVNKLSKGNGHGHAHPDDIEKSSHMHEQNDVNIPHCIGCSEDPVAELDTWQINAEEEIQAAENNTAVESGNSLDENNRQKEIVLSDKESGSEDGTNTKPNMKIDTASLVKTKDTAEKARLENMGLQTAIAIALHNFPEGLATFVAVLEEPKVGVILAIAIGIHNIPEGLCVSLPVYYASGNRSKAFWWGALSGVTEPVGALFGWLIFAQSFNDSVYGIMFGLVGGMMVMISFRELLPTAQKFDPKDTVVTYSAVFGMFVMAISLVFNNI